MDDPSSDHGNGTPTEAQIQDRALAGIDNSLVVRKMELYILIIKI
jgi:hypothetical protein